MMLQPSHWRLLKEATLFKYSRATAKSREYNKEDKCNSTYGYMQERHSHSTHTPLIEIIA